MRDPSELASISIQIIGNGYTSVIFMITYALVISLYKLIILRVKTHALAQVKRTALTRS